jgi:ubiquinone/menaquinone biosynthesis C-methylase UbiE
MEHPDHVNLLRAGIPAHGGVWADLGSGTGAFTLALADLIGPSGRIYSVDRDARALSEQQQQMHDRFPEVQVQYLTADFTRPIDLPLLDGIVLANSLHFHRRKEPIVQLIKGYLQPNGRLIVVEYNIEDGNSAVPHPLPFTVWKWLAASCGFSQTELLATRPSHFLKEIYSAVSW